MCASWQLLDQGSLWPRQRDAMCLAILGSRALQFNRVAFDFRPLRAPVRIKSWIAGAGITLRWRSGVPPDARGGGPQSNLSVIDQQAHAKPARTRAMKRAPYFFSPGLVLGAAIMRGRWLGRRRIVERIEAAWLGNATPMMHDLRIIDPRGRQKWHGDNH